MYFRVPAVHYWIDYGSALLNLLKKCAVEQINNIKLLLNKDGSAKDLVVSFQSAK